MIRAWENAEFVRYGAVRHGTFLVRPDVLDAGLFLKEHPSDERLRAVARL